MSEGLGGTRCAEVLAALRCVAEMTVKAEGPAEAGRRARC